MSDANLRELERRWRETGSVEDEAALVKESLRRGTLRPRCVELAARLGNGAAARALEPEACGRSLFEPGEPWDVPPAWREFLIEVGCEGVYGACLAAAPFLAARSPTPLAPETRVVLKASVTDGRLLEEVVLPAEDCRVSAVLRLARTLKSNGFKPKPGNHSAWLEAESWCDAIFLVWGEDSLDIEERDLMLGNIADSLSRWLLWGGRREVHAKRPPASEAANG